MRIRRAVLVTLCVTWVNVLAQEPDTPIRVGTGGVVQPRPTKEVQPNYPYIAVSASVSGTVLVEAVVDSTGRVADAKVVQSIPLLDNAALDAFRQWTFEPTVVDGRRVPVVMSVSVNFRLGNGAAPAPMKVEASSGALPWDFAFVYRFGCNGPPLVAVRIDSSHDRFVLPAYGPRPNVVVLGPVTTLPLQLSTDDLRNIHRAYAAVASVANRDALTSWIDPPVGSAVRKESLEVDVAGEKPVATNRPTWSHLDVRAAGMWTAVSPARPGSQSPEYDERVRVLLQLIERTVASKEPVSKIPVDERSCP